MRGAGGDRGEQGSIAEELRNERGSDGTGEKDWREKERGLQRTREEIEKSR